MKRLVAAVVPVALLAGCAVVGQPGDPGVAASWNGTVVTNAEVGAWGEGLTGLGLPNDPGAAVTFLVLAPEVEDFAAEHDISVTDAELTQNATEWLATGGLAESEVTPHVLDVLRAAWLLNASFGEEGFGELLSQELTGIEADAVVSPLYGDFSAELAINHLSSASDYAQTDPTGLGALAYLNFVFVSGFDTTATAPWIVSGTAPAAPAA